MPVGENDDIAKSLKSSYMGRLIPINRFVLIDEDGIHNTEGITHPSYENYVVDPSVTVFFNAKPKPKVLWVDPEKKPWRMLTSMLSFWSTSKSDNFKCFQLENVLERKKDMTVFSIWSGGVRVSSNAGEQYLTGTDNFVESEVMLSSDLIGESFYGYLENEMKYWEENADILYKSIFHYFSELHKEGKSLAVQGTNLYWQLCEGEFQILNDICYGNPEKRYELRKKIRSYALQIYNEQCPNLTARQLEAWAKNRPVIKIKEEN
jgi:CRISPR system Cascade subunit CasA